jgi:aminomethyltransferase
MSDLKRTPLYDAHVAAGAKMVPFAGFEMPVSYSGILEEHDAVRERVGLFDVSHMGEFIVSGAGTWDYLNQLVSNNVAKLVDNGVIYTVMCRENGTVVDDLLITRLAPERALVVVNASNIDKDYAHMSAFLRDDVTLENVSDDYALIAVQGPASLALLKSIPRFSDQSERLPGIGYYQCLPADDGVIISRTGYTGERGFELFVPSALAMPVWQELMEHGAALGVQPIGLAARDTLRFEACFCLYGHELDDETNPLEAGLNWVVKFKKGDFVGRDALAAAKAAGLAKRLVGLEFEGRNIGRQGYDVIHDGAVVGRVTSGTFSPTLKKSLCLAYVDGSVLDSSSDVNSLAVQVRKRVLPAARVDIPFYPSRARESWTG